MSLSFRKCAMATAVVGALFAGNAVGAVRLSNAFDGNWFDPAANGRGLAVDFVPNVTADAGVFFGAMFSYDNDGNPFWLTLQSGADVGEFDTTITAPIYRVAAGTWPTPGAAGVTQIGTATVTVNSCNSMTVALDMDASSGLADVTYDMTPTVGSDPAACVYQRSFTGCPSFATAAPAFGARACMLSGNYPAQDITLTNEITWVIEGKVGIGGDNAQPSTLRIEPGTLLVSTGDTFDHIAVSRGSKIYAEGTASAPIVLTSANELPGFPAAPQPKEVGGLVLSGNAPANCNPNCVAEWDNTNRYGGNDSDDDSGVIRHMQVRYAGYVFTTNRELNSFTFNAVGRGTTLEYLQSYNGGDDGVEFFGGTANLRYFVNTCGGDDAIDWDEGYTGKIQFALVTQGGTACAGEDHGFEVSNSPTNFDATPRSKPTVANFTLVGNVAGSGRDGFNIKEGTGGNWFNGIAAGFKRACISIEGAATEAAAGPTNNLTGVLTMNNTLVDCATNFRDSSVTAGYTAAWFAAQSGNQAVDPQLSGFLPAGSAHLGKHFKPASDWFMPTDYAGAFRSNQTQDNWTLGWTKGVN